MRYIHPVGLHETFIASGIYTHYQDDEPTGSLEHWSIHQLPDGAHFIRVDDDWRQKDGSSVLIEAWRSPEGRIERFDLHAFGGKEAEIKEVRATFMLNENNLDVGRSVGKSERQQIEINLPEDHIASPKSLIFSGLEVVELAKHNGQPVTVVSYLPTFMDEGMAFRPVAYKQSARYIEDETIMIGSSADKAYLARRYEQSDPDGFSPVWLDRHGTLLRFRSANGRHSAILTQYARKPD